MVVTATETPNPDLQINGISIEKVQSYPQLGLILNEKMNWDAHIDNIISKANKKIGLIWRLSNHVPRFAVEIIYTTYIRPQLEYCAVIYNNCTKETSNRLESCQRRAAIACTRAYQRTNTITLLEELGWDTPGPSHPGGQGGRTPPHDFSNSTPPPPLRFRHNTHNDMYAGRGFATSGTTYIVWVIECGL